MKSLESETEEDGDIELAQTEEDIKPEDAQRIEAQFEELYAQNTDLQAMISSSDKPTITVLQKYQILQEFNKEQTEELANFLEDDSEFVEHEGLKYRRVAIDGSHGTFYMDEAGQIYDQDFTLMGEANDESEEDTIL